MNEVVHGIENPWYAGMSASRVSHLYCFVSGCIFPFLLEIQRPLVVALKEWRAERAGRAGRPERPLIEL